MGLPPRLFFICYNAYDLGGSDLFMPKTVYTNLTEINKLQENIMVFVEEWVRKENTPVPRKKIIEHMGKEGIKYFTVRNALKSLLGKKYIRRAQVISNQTFYVQLRKI